MRYKVKDIKAAMPKMKASRDSIWVKLWARPLSYVLAAISMNIGLTANQVSVISMIEAIVASVLISIDNSVCRWIGVALIVFWICIDCVDGDIARYKKEGSLIGEYFDAIGGYTFNAFVFIGASVAAFHTTKLVPAEYTYLLVLAGGLSSVADIFARLVYQKYTSNIFSLNKMLGIEQSGERENDVFYKENQKMSIKMFSLWVDRLIGQANLFGPILAIATFFGLLDVLTAFYMLYHLAALLFSLIMYGTKAATYKREHL